MKRQIEKKHSFMLIFTFALVIAMTGCGRSGGSKREVNTSAAAAPTVSISQDSSNRVREDETDIREYPAGADALEVRFGDDGEPFIMNLEDNPTATAIAGYVGTASWRLPIYHYDDYDDWEVMQYYDIPSRYEIPSNAETVTSEKAGDVYYSEPNRIILFYQDAEVTGEYTKVGTIEYSEAFQSAVEDNPVLEGWGNKIVHIDSIK
ncbi:MULTISPECIES: cyclophilin-like fold protein [unclassified Clostridium]|uniref:cyclophilin-like fold protein n=1 Tax=unclassified Clostridium TaxID=2614128 RepID=UPI00110593DA|nr:MULTISPECIES: cyclophilin-like fold protein [unclassified Clostridium]